MSDAIFPSRPAARPRCQLNINLEPELKLRLTVAAAKRGCFESRLVRDALLAFLADTV